MVLLASSVPDLYNALEGFGAEHEVSVRDSEPSSLNLWFSAGLGMDCSLRIGGELLLQTEEFKYLGSCSQVMRNWSPRFI